MSRRSKRLRSDESREAKSDRSAVQTRAPMSYAPFGSALGNGTIAAALQDHLGYGGETLDDATRLTMESAFGADFTDVRLHTNAAADASARHMSARAFTSGSDIGFRSGAYTPNSASGRGLLAHELAHVLQQRGAARTEPASNDAALEGAARGAAQAVQAGESANVSQPGAAPAVQCDLLDYVPGGRRAASFVSSAFDELGRVDRDTINRAVERALRSRVMRGVLLSNPAFVPHAVAIEFLASNPGALSAIWSFVLNPQPKIDELEDRLRPHILNGVQIAITQSAELLRGLGVPEQHIAALSRVTQIAATFALGAVEFLIDDVIVDTIAFHQLRTERESYNEAWQKYEAGLIDTHDIVVEHLAFALSVLGRIEDIISVIMWVAGIAGVGAVGGTVGSAVPVAGTAAGAGAGGAVGGAAGLTASEVFGLIVSLGPAALEIERILKATAELLLAEQSDEQRNEDYAQIASGAVTLAVMAVLAFLPGLALRLGRRLGRRLRRLLPDIRALLPGASRTTTAPSTPTPTPTATAREHAPETHRAAEVAVPGRRVQTPATARGREVAQPSQPATRPAEAPVQTRREAVAPNAGRPPAASDAERSNIRAFPTERARPPGQTVRETPGELVQGPWRPRPEGPEPPNAASAAQQREVDVVELRTGTGDVLYQEVPRTASPDVPRAMTGEPPQGPTSRATTTSATTQTATERRPRGGRPRRPRQSEGEGGQPGERRPEAVEAREPAPRSAREEISDVLGGLNVPDARVDEISAADAARILRAPEPPAGEPRARDIYRYLRYKYQGRGAANARNGRRVLTYREWSRRVGLRQEQARRRREERPNERTEDRERPRTDRRTQEPEEVLRGPQTTAEATEEAARGSATRSQEDRQAESDAGRAMEAGPARQIIEQEFGPDAQVIPRENFPDWLREAYRRAGVLGPDFVVITEGRVVVVDSVPGPRGVHLEKTQRDVDIANAAPRRPPGTRVEGREVWWGHTEQAEDVLPPSEIARMERQAREDYGDRPIDPEVLRTEEEGFDEALDLPQFSRPILPSRTRDPQRTIEDEDVD